jgi:hypothetical protein
LVLNPFVIGAPDGISTIIFYVVQNSGTNSIENCPSGNEKFCKYIQEDLIPVTVPACLPESAQPNNKLKSDG